MKFLYKFSDRIFHVHMKDVAWGLGVDAGVFGGHVDFHKPSRYWDFKSMGRGNINFEKIIRALNDINYGGPLSVEWEDGAMDREFGATESAAFVKKPWANWCRYCLSPRWRARNTHPTGAEDHATDLYGQQRHDGL